MACCQITLLCSSIVFLTTSKVASAPCGSVVLTVNIRDLSSGSYRLQKRSIPQQVSFVSINRQPIPVSTCQIPPCAGVKECHHPSDMDDIPFGTPMLKPVPEPKNSQTCQCSPDKIKTLLEQANKAGKPLNMKSIGCGGIANPTAVPPQPALPQPMALKPASKEDDCASCSKPKYKDGMKMQCTCSGKKKTVKLRPLCPCEQHQPPVSQEENGPRPGTRSLGCQCCVCDDSTLKAKGKGKKLPMGQIELLGPAGGLAQKEKGGIYTQAGLITASTTTETSTSPRKNCACRDKGKKGKKKNNVICECPPPEPEPEPEPEPFPCMYDNNYPWFDPKQALKLKSDMTQTQSGFKFFKKKKPPREPEAEYTVEDAIRYYVTMNPNLLKDLVPPPLECKHNVEYKDCTCEGNKKVNNDTECTCPHGGESLEDSGGPYGGGGPPVLPCPAALPCPTASPCPAAEPVKEEEGPFRGFKFSMGGKGSASKGFSGICCFDMIQETNKTRSRRSSHD